VSAEATPDMDALLGRAIGDPRILCGRILEHVLERFAYEYAASDPERPPEEAIAVALGDRLAEMIVGPKESAPTNGHIDSRWAEQPEPYDELFERDAALAAALGACDCWGQDAHCPLCRGAGGPGWTLPDRQLFAEYVYPALRALPKRDNGSRRARNESPNGNKEESDG